MIKPKWNNISHVRPNKSGFYMYKTRYGIDIFYYCKPIDYFIYIEGESDYLDGYPVEFMKDRFWASMPRIPQSKLLDNRIIKIAL